VARPRTAGPWGTVAVVGGAVGLVGLVVLAARPARAAPTKRRRIALIGDSYAVGLGPELAKILPDFQCSGDGSTAVGASCEAKKGVSAAQWLHCSPSCGDWLPGYQPTVTLVSLGTNGGPNQNAADFHAIVRALHGIGSSVVWIEPPAGVANIDAVRAIIESLGVATIPATQTPLGGDGLHPAASYAPWAVEIAQALR
jgi:hypothetical protein